MMGEGAGGTPIVIVRGITYEDRVCQVFRSKETDVIRKYIKEANTQQ
jgi:F420-0:gamma-glutamyl ligase